jgi:NosR/NirI family nitrous oxide reductase transcriptional regulator
MFAVRLSLPTFADPDRARKLWSILAGLLLALLLPVVATAQVPHLARFLAENSAADLVPGATSYGEMRGDLPVVPVLRGTTRIGWAFITSDFVGTTGYSGKPIHVLVAIDEAARIIGLRLVAHSEPIVLIGIPESRIRALIADRIGLDLAGIAQAGGTEPNPDIISGVTVTIMVIDDSIVRSGIRVARALGLGGLSPAQTTGPRFTLDPDAVPAGDWFALVGDGTIRRLTLDVGQVNDAFAAMDDPRAALRALSEPPDTTFIDLYTTMVSHPGIGRVMLGEAEQANLTGWLREGEHAILVAGRGMYSFKGSGYVRGGLFDRIALIQGDISIRFRDRDHRRPGAIAVPGVPQFSEIDLFRIPADAGFDPAEPWRLQLLVQRDVAALERLFTTFDLGYQLPRSYLTEIAPPAAVSEVHDAAAETAAQMALIERIWWDKRLEIAGLLAMLGLLSGAFFFQSFLTRSERVTRWFRLSFLTVTLVFLGWYASAQLSIVNLMALAHSLKTGFSWQAFMLEPLTFLLWWSVAAALIFWGRGAYCGWLCPFGALQELTNQIARALRVPQVALPWGLHERLWALKYIIALVLFAAALSSLDRGEQLAEIEPFKTAIVLKFAREWPFVTFALVLLLVGLFVERFYCRYLCPLGAALAIPARIRMFDWLKRYRECGNPCQTCRNECFVQAIHPTGEINPNECLNCLHCQVLYQSETKCPVVIRQVKRRAAVAGSDPSIMNHPHLKKEKSHV